jgi:hypothetical protein
MHPSVSLAIRTLAPNRHVRTGDYVSGWSRNTNRGNRAITLTLAYSHNLTVRVHGKDGKVHEVRSLKPLYTGDVHTIPLDIDPATIQPSARVETRGTEALIIREIGP